MDNRLFATIEHQICPYGCIYCFTKCQNYKQNISIDKMPIDKLLALTSDIETIQPACDTEFLLHPDWKNILLNLSQLDKNISFATKTAVNNEELKILTKVNKILESKQKILNIGISITKIDNYKELEPNAPSPNLRIKSLKKLYEAGINSNIIIRPLFPNLSYKEIQYIFENTYKYTEGYIIGPLYVNDEVKKYLNSINCDLPLEKKSPEWNDNNELEVLYCPETVKIITDVASKFNKHIFFSNEEYITYSLTQKYKKL